MTGFNAGGKSSSYQSLLLLAQSFKAGQSGKRISLNGPLIRLGTAGEALSDECQGHRGISITIEDPDESITWKLIPHQTDEGALIIDKREHVAFRPDFIEDSRSLIQTITDLIYISAIRGTQQEVFASPGVVDQTYADVGAYGEYSAYWFNMLSDDEVDTERMHPNESGKTLRRQVCAWTGDLFPGFDITSTKLNDTGLIQLQMRTSTNDPYRRPSNLGYGLSYAFPIILASLTAQKNQLLIVDSPEAHLHPRAQSNIGRFLALIAESGVQVVIETHSDHVLNGIRIAIKNKSLAAENSSIYFFREGAAQGESKKHVKALVDENGRINNWPEGFFDQIENDLSQL